MELYITNLLLFFLSFRMDYFCFQANGQHLVFNGRQWLVEK